MTEPHRKRVKHFEVPGEAHFLTFSCYKRLPLFSKDRTRRWIVDALDQARSKHQFDLWGWVIMPEHVHLLIKPLRTDYRIKTILAVINQPVSRRAIGWLREHDPVYLSKLAEGGYCARFWQRGGGYDSNVEDPEAAVEILTYIHLNPVRRGLVEKPTEWYWSSANGCDEDSTDPITIDRSLVIAV